MATFKFGRLFGEERGVGSTEVEREFGNIAALRRVVVSRAENVSEVEAVAFGVENSNVRERQFSCEEFVGIVRRRAGGDDEVEI